MVVPGSGSSSLLYPREFPAVGSCPFWAELPTRTVISSLWGIPSGFGAVGKQGVLQAPALGLEACCLHRAGQHLLQDRLGAFKVTGKRRGAENSPCSRKARSGLKHTEQELCW